MGEYTFTKQQWQQVAADKLAGDEIMSYEEFEEVIDYLWDYLPPKFHTSVIKILEAKHEKQI